MSSVTSDTYDSVVYGLRNKAGLEWWEDALCRTEDHNLNFFDGKPSSVKNCQAMCARCPSRLKCLAFAIDNDVTDGVFGGMTRGERVVLA